MIKYDRCYYDQEPNHLLYEQWMDERDNYHKEDGPAYITYYETEQIFHESFFIHGILGSLKGPSRIWYDENGNIKRQEWYINGDYLTYEQWLCNPKRIEYMVKKELSNEI